MVVVSHGLGAPTAMIAKEAGIANGTLFTYFETKAALFNALYLDLKADLASEAAKRLSDELSLRENLQRAWTGWMGWAISNPEKRKALAQLTVSEEITSETRAAGNRAMAKLGSLMEQVHASGPMREVPLALVAGIMTSIADATMDYAIGDPANAELHAKAGFNALWRMVG